jgi:hypothetical protein
MNRDSYSKFKSLFWRQNLTTPARFDLPDNIGALPLHYCISTSALMSVPPPEGDISTLENMNEKDTAMYHYYELQKENFSVKTEFANALMKNGSPVDVKVRKFPEFSENISCEISRKMKIAILKH